jgi:hypothetical protein
MNVGAHRPYVRLTPPPWRLSGSALRLGCGSWRARRAP